MKKLYLLTLIGTLQFAYAQESEDDKPANFHRLTLEMSHAHVPEGFQNGEKQWLVMGSWGFNYDYWFHPQWAVGLHADLVVENFEVEKSGEEGSVLERSYPFAPALIGIFKPGKHLMILLGPGGEFSKEESFFLIRAGLEYGWELPGEWELGVSLMNDFKVDAYNSWTIGVGISKILGKAAEGGE